MSGGISKADRRQFSATKTATLVQKRIRLTTTPNLTPLSLCGRRNPYDESFWYLKCRALTAIDWLDDIELLDDTLGDQLLDENAIAQMPRPGTSMNRPATGAVRTAAGGQVRGRTGRPASGFARPSSSALRPGTSLERALGTAAGRRGTTARPVTSSGRFVRLGTASMLDHCGDEFIDSDKIDIRKYAKKPGTLSLFPPPLSHPQTSPEEVAC